MGSPSAPASKDEWRTKFRSYRRSLSERSCAARSSLIVHRALGLEAVAEADVVHTYWPVTDKREVDTRPLIAAVWGRGATVVLPVITSFDAESPTLEHRRYVGTDALTTNKWGIPEPTDSEVVSPDALDVVIVPALGAGHNGHRVGHGSGYYDAFLESLSCPRVALVYDECMASSLPNESHDVPMTTIVTEKNVFDVSS